MNLIKSDIFPVSGVVVSNKGGRPENQDDFGFIDTPLGFLLIVCDGMGGGPGGKTASCIAKYEMMTALLECNEHTPKEHAFKMAAARAHEAMERKMREIPSLQGMGSTFVAVLIDRKSAFVAHAGDSRCYLLRGSRCICRTVDHSLVSELVKSKVLTEEEARVSPQSNVVTRGLGSTSNPVPEVEEVTFKRGDRFVLCTDGVWGIMPNKDFLKHLHGHDTSIKNIVEDMAIEIDKIGFAKGGGHDNHTLAVFKVGLSSEKKAPFEFSGRFLLIFAITVAVILLSLGIFALLNNFSLGDSEDVSSPTGAQSTAVIIDDPSIFASDTEDVSESEENNKGSIVNKDSVKKVVKNFRDKQIAEMEKNNSNRKATQADRDAQKESTKKKDANKRESSEAKVKNDSRTEGKQESEQDVQLSPMQLTDKLIHCHKNALNVSGKSITEAQALLDKYHEEVNSLMNDLLKVLKPGSANNLAKSIKEYMDKNNRWVVTKLDDKGISHPTKPTKNLIEKQLEKLKKLKERLSE